MSREAGHVGSEIIFIVPYVVGFAAVMTAGGTFLVWLVWTVARRWGPRPVRKLPEAFPIRAVASLMLCLGLLTGCIRACQPVPQPESARTVAAFEVPLHTEADRADFLAILSREAAAEGLDVNIEGERDLEVWSEMSPDLRQTIGVSIWRGDVVRGNEVHVSDRYHNGQAWISFSRGEDPSLARRFRERLMSRISDRWPDTLSIPIPATGGLPLKQDLVRVDQGYEIDPARLAGYTCDPAMGPEAAPREACH